MIVLADVPPQDARSAVVCVVAEGRRPLFFTGKLVGTPTQGHGKVVHTKAWLEKLGKRLEDFETVYFYSDSHNDIPLMSVVTHPVATNPNAALTSHAAEKGWPTINIFND